MYFRFFLRQDQIKATANEHHIHNIQIRVINETTLNKE